MKPANAFKLGWMITGIIVGVIVVVLISFTSPRPQSIPFQVVDNGPILTLAVPQSPPQTNWRVELGFMPTTFPKVPDRLDSFDTPIPFLAPAPPSVDLIDTGYQADVRFEGRE